MDYRKLYANYYVITLPDGFDIHHIDGNRENNDISNLLLLPSKLHHQYHFYKSIAMRWNPDGDLYSQHVGTYMINSVEKYCEACKECRKWVALKDYMDCAPARDCFPDDADLILEQIRGISHG